MRANTTIDTHALATGLFNGSGLNHILGDSCIGSGDTETSMSRQLLAQLVRIAHANPSARGRILPLVKKAKEFSTEKELESYLKDHPNADRANHSVKTKEDKPKEEGKSDEKTPSLEKVPEKATVKQLPPDLQQEIGDYNIQIVGKDAKKAIEIARKLKKGIDKAADICKMSPSVCKKNKGLTRDKMPQIDGEKSVKEMLASSKPDERAKGEAMVQAGADPNSDKTILEQMLSHFEKNGIKTTVEEMPVGHMKATQSEIKAEKVYGMADAHLKGKFNDIDASVVVSKDGHILDGHHRWAALLTIDPSRKMKVKKVDMTMDELLKEAASFPGVYKADFSGKPLPKEDQEKYKKENKSKWDKAEKKGSIRRTLLGDTIRLAHQYRDLRPLLLPAIRKSLS